VAGTTRPAAHSFAPLWVPDGMVIGAVGSGELGAEQFGPLQGVVGAAGIPGCCA
jgi:hypothetical protein